MELTEAKWGVYHPEEGDWEMFEDGTLSSALEALKEYEDEGVEVYVAKMTLSIYTEPDEAA